MVYRQHLQRYSVWYVVMFQSWVIHPVTWHSWGWVSGFELVLYSATLAIMHKNRGGDARAKRSNARLLLLSTGLLAMITIFLIVQAFFGEQMWITNEFYPGGTAGYFADHAAIWYETLGSAAGVVLSLMSDGFLVRLFRSNTYSSR